MKVRSPKGKGRWKGGRNKEGRKRKTKKGEEKKKKRKEKLQLLAFSIFFAINIPSITIMTSMNMELGRGVTVDWSWLQ